MKIKVFIAPRKSQVILIDKTDNFCLIHDKLNEIYGLTGWLGYEIVN